ncbi:MAG: hypothetical protein R2710_30595 [Acidimicrobiales bacterium]
MQEALAPLDSLAASATDGADPAVLEARLNAVTAVAAKAGQGLDEVVARGRLATVPVADLAPHLIETAEQLDDVLTRVRQRVGELIAEGKQVRLR